MLLVSFIYVCIFMYYNFELLLSFILLNKMVDDIMLVLVICEVFDEVYLLEFVIVEVVIEDICVIFNCDLVVKDYMMVLIYFKGF